MFKKILLMTFLSISIIFAQNYKDCVSPLWYFQNFSSANSALANNTTAYKSGLASLSSNPAALGMEKETQFGFSIRSNNLSQNSKFDNSDDLQRSDYSANDLVSSNFDGFGAILPIPVYRGSFVFGFSYSQIAIYNDQVDVNGTFYYDGSPFNADNLFEETGVMNSYRMGFAVEYQKNLYIGSSLNFYNGNKSQVYNYIDKDLTQVFDFYDKITTNIEVNPKYSGLNFDIGILYNKDNFSFGANFTSPFTINTEEKYTNEETWFYDDGEKDIDKISDKIKYNIKVPSSFSIGVGYNIGNITLLADLKTQDWHNIEFDSKLYDYEYDDDGEVISKTSTDKRINGEIRNHLTQTFDYGIGLTTEIFNNYTLNIGHRIISLPYFNMPKSDEKIYLTGIGVNTKLFNMLQIGVSYQFEMGKNEIEKEFFEYPIYRKYNSQNFTLTTSLIF